MLEFLPHNVKESLRRINLVEVYELRLRADKPVTVNYRGEYRYLGFYGITDQEENALHLTQEEIADCVYRAGNCSIYSIEEQLKQGFVTAACGERIGIAGEYVFENGKPLALRNFSSVCIRVPHEVVGCGQAIYTYCMSDIIRNILIMSPPGLGKTTILRDLGKILSENTRKNIMICDERGEISAGKLGNTCDILKFCNKATAFDAGIRALRPDIIITDELSLEDLEAVKKAIWAGVNVLASAHFNDIVSLPKSFLGIFDRYIVLEPKKIGVLKGIYDKNGNEV